MNLAYTQGFKSELPFHYHSSLSSINIDMLLEWNVLFAFNSVQSTENVFCSFKSSQSWCCCLVTGDITWLVSSIYTEEFMDLPKVGVFWSVCVGNVTSTPCLPLASAVPVMFDMFADLGCCISNPGFRLTGKPWPRPRGQTDLITHSDVKLRVNTSLEGMAMKKYWCIENYLEV